MTSTKIVFCHQHFIDFLSNFNELFFETRKLKIRI